MGRACPIVAPDSSQALGWGLEVLLKPTVVRRTAAPLRALGGQTRSERQWMWGGGPGWGPRC